MRLGAGGPEIVNLSLPTVEKLPNRLDIRDSRSTHSSRCAQTERSPIQIHVLRTGGQEHQSKRMILRIGVAANQ